MIKMKSEEIELVCGGNDPDYEGGTSIWDWLFGRDRRVPGSDEDAPEEETASYAG